MIEKTYNVGGIHGRCGLSNDDERDGVRIH